MGVGALIFRQLATGAGYPSAVVLTAAGMLGALAERAPECRVGGGPSNSRVGARIVTTHHAEVHVQHFVRPDGSPPVNGYSHTVAFTGPMVAVSGQVPLDANGVIVGESDPAAQIRQVFANLATALHAAGSSLQDVVKLTVYLTDLADLDAFRRIRDEHLNLDHPPACSLVRVAGLVHPAFRVEIDALAVSRPPHLADGHSTHSARTEEQESRQS